MKFYGKIIPLFFLIVLPVLLFIAAYLLKEAGGPYYLNYYDPSYVYLVNSLNFIQFAGAGHVDHPGTSVQLIGAVVLKLFFLSKDSGFDFLNSVFSNPEFYLNLINKFFVLLNCLTLFLTGYIIFKLTNNLYISLLVQFSPFISFEILYSLVIISPENFLISVTLCLSSLLFIYIYKNNINSSSFKFTSVLAIICGIGSVTKLTFIPFCIIPLILIQQFKYKVLFVLLTVLIFLIILLPAVSNLTYLSDWIKNLVFGTGIHGQTNISVFKTSVFLQNIISILSKDILFAVIYFIILFTVVISLFLKNNNTADNNSGTDNIIFKKEKLILISIFTALTIQILIVAKNYLPYAQYYLVPSFVLSLTGLAVSILLLYKIYGIEIIRLKINFFFAAAIIIVSFYSLIKFTGTCKDAAEARDEAYKISNFVKKYSGKELIIPSLICANEDCALAITTINGYSGKNSAKYQSVISQYLTSKIQYNPWDQKLFSVPDNIDIKKTLNESKKIIVQLASNTSIEFFINLINERYDIKVSEYKLLLERRNLEFVYEIVLAE